MANSSRDLYRAFLKKGVAKEDAFFAVLDHYFDLWLTDRDRYDERLKKLEERAGAAKTGE